MFFFNRMVGFMLSARKIDENTQQEKEKIWRKNKIKTRFSTTTVA